MVTSAERFPVTMAERLRASITDAFTGAAVRYKFRLLRGDSYLHSILLPPHQYFQC